MSEAKKYDRSYKEQSVKLALEIGVKRASEELKVPYGTLYGWVQAAKNGDLDIEERTTETAPRPAAPPPTAQAAGAARLIRSRSTATASSRRCCGAWGKLAVWSSSEPCESSTTTLQPVR